MKSNDVYALAEEAAAAAMVHSRVGKPKLGLVLGSGLGHYAERLAEASSLAYAEIPHFPRTSVAGHAGRLWFGRVGNMPVAVLQGRVHLYEGFTPPEVVFPVRTLAALGVEAVCLTNAAGGVRESFAGGELMRIVDHLNLTGQNPLVGPDDGSRGPRFPDLSQAYDAELGEILDEVAGSQGLDLHAGIYAQLTGPSYETPAEVRMLRMLGADAVGMSTVHETIALRHLGVRVAAISCITNPAAGVSSRPVLHAEVTEVAAGAGREIAGLIDGFVARLGKSAAENPGNAKRP
jgi:purine-nucleoside phosphorylase